MFAKVIFFFVIANTILVKVERAYKIQNVRLLGSTFELTGTTRTGF